MSKKKSQKEEDLHTPGVEKCEPEVELQRGNC